MPEVPRGEGFLIDVDRHDAPAAEEPGFDLHIAQTVARRVKQALFARCLHPVLHRFDVERVQGLRLHD